MMNSFFRSLITLLISALLFCNISYAQDEDSGEDINTNEGLVENYETESVDDVINEAQRSGKAKNNYQFLFSGANDAIGKGLFQNKTLAEYLFNNIANYSYNYNALSESLVPSIVNFGLGIKGGVARHVIKNEDIQSSYTVLDKVTLSAHPSVGASYMGASASVGLSFGLDYYNIKIVKKRQRTQVFPINDIEQSFKKKLKKESLKKKSEIQIEKENEKYSNFVELTKAPRKFDVYLGRLWNPITMAFRLPLHWKAAKRMDDYEIISYSLNGGVSMGLGFSGGEIPGLDIMKFGANVSIYFNGEHRISVLKEAPTKPGDNYVRVMVSRKLNRGVGFSIGSTTDMLSGVLTIDNFAGNLGWNLFRGILDVKPFRLSVDKRWSNFYDTIYRYDLNTKEGRKAYNRAALGSFKLSEKYAFDKSFKPLIGENLAVQRLVKRKGLNTSLDVVRKIGLFLFKYKDSNKLDFKKTKVINETGEENRIFESNFESGNYREVLLAYNESSENKFKIKLNENKFYKTRPEKRDAKSLWKRANYLKIPKDAMTLFVTMTKVDDQTYFDEYRKYVMTFEEVLGRPGLFPLPPNTKFNIKKIINGDIGRTDFRLILNLDYQQLFKFMNYPKEKMWEALIEAFGAKGKGWDDSKKRIGIYLKNIAVYGATFPVSLVGKRLDHKDNLIVARLKLKDWVKLQDSQKEGPSAMVKAFGEFFKTGDYGDEMTKLLRIVLKGEKIRFSGSANSKLILDHDIFKTDDRVLFSDPDLTNFGKLFDSYRVNEIRKSGVNVTGLSARIIGSQYFRVSFQLEKEAKAVFFHLATSNFLGFLTDKSKSTVVVENKNNMFKKGLNIIQVKLSNKEHPLYPLYSKIKPVKRFFFNGYLLGVAASKDKKNYGLMDYSRFDSMIVNDPNELENFNKTTIKEEQICTGRFASELILLLGDNPLRVCPDNLKQSNGICKPGEGIIPYSWYKNRALAENIKARDKWIIDHCPRMEERDKIKKYLSKTIICSSRTGKSLIKILKDDEPFYVCSSDSERDNRGLCNTGIIPYTYYPIGFSESNKRKRNEWIMQFCPLTDRDLNIEYLKSLASGIQLKESTNKYLNLIKKLPGKDLKGTFNYFGGEEVKLSSDLYNFYPKESGLLSFSYKGVVYHNELKVNYFEENNRGGSGAATLIFNENIMNNLTPKDELFQILRSSLGEKGIQVYLKIRMEDGKKVLMIRPKDPLSKFNFKLLY